MKSMLISEAGAVLSCSSTKTCVALGTAMGCCDAGLVATCEHIYTTCLNYGDSCGAACESDPKILKWYVYVESTTKIAMPLLVARSSPVVCTGVQIILTSLQFINFLKILRNFQL